MPERGDPSPPARVPYVFPPPGTNEVRISHPTDSTEPVEPHHVTVLRPQMSSENAEEREV